MADSESIKKNKIRKKRAMLRRTRKKISIAFLICFIFLMVLIGRIIFINYNKGDDYSKIVLNHQSYTSTTIPFKRGQITDSSGTVLAYSEKVYNLIFDPKLVLSDDKFKEPTVTALVKCFGIDRDKLETILATKTNSHYEKLLKELTKDQIAEFKALQDDKTNNPYIKGVTFEESYIRQYPFSTLACDVIGFASSVNGGELGLENYYNDELSGTDGVNYNYVDENLDVQSKSKQAVDGLNVVTSLDYNVQSVIEKNIISYNEERPSKNTAVLVMNPNNGEIVGMASYPNFDLNNPRDMSKVYTEEQLASMSDEDVTNSLYSLWSNYAVSQTYEPGSTFKPFTVAAGLDDGVISDSDTFFCKGYEEVGGFQIGCHARSKGGHGLITLEQSLMESCNPAMMQIAAKIGGPKFAQYTQLFGFGAKTGVDLPGEEVGITKAENMSETDLACNSFGQNVNVTMVQMAAAFSSAINGGNYYQPHIVRRLEKASGEVVKSFDPEIVKQTVTRSTSKLLQKYLRATVDDGLAKKAGVTGYSIAGKTGTAQKLPREDKKWLISFIGFAPAEDPQFVIYCIIDEPYETNGTSGSSTDVLTLTHNILSDLLPYMNVYKDAEDTPEDTSNAPDEGTVEIDLQ